MNKEKDILFTIQFNDVIDNALRKIESNKYFTLIVIDDRFRVVGTLTEQDIHTALIAERSLLTPICDIMDSHFLSVMVDKKYKAKEIFDAHFNINLIPVITKEGLLEDILFRDKISLLETS